MRKKGQKTETQIKAARIAGGKKAIFKDIIENRFPELRLLYMCKLIF